MPDEDCCTLFTPKRPATRARLTHVLEAEQALSIGEMVATAVAATTVEEFRFPVLEYSVSHT